jgi:hypothetical protein
MKIFLLNKSEKGQSLIELGVSLVFILIILAGVVDITRLGLYLISIRDAAQEGAVYGSIFPSDCSGISNRVYDGSSGWLSPGRVDVQISVNGVSCESASATTDACAPHEIRINVVQPSFPITMPFLGAVLGRQTLSLNTNASESILRPICSP